jgi:hypothetical protein
MSVTRTRRAAGPADAILMGAPGLAFLAHGESDGAATLARGSCDPVEGGVLRVILLKVEFFDESGDA